MRDYIKKMLSSGDEVSSKRMLSLFGTMLFTGVVITHLCGVDVSDTVIWALITLIGIPTAGTTIEKFNRHE